MTACLGLTGQCFAEERQLVAALAVLLVGGLVSVLVGVLIRGLVGTLIGVLVGGLVAVLVGILVGGLEVGLAGVRAVGLNAVRVAVLVVSHFLFTSLCKNIICGFNLAIQVNL